MNAVRLPLFRQAVSGLFPRAVFVDWPDPRLGSARSFLLREGEQILWIDWAQVSFSRDQIPDYLARTQEINLIFRSPLQGVLIAPDFEAGVPEMLGLIRMPIRLFRFREGRPLDADRPAVQFEEIDSAPREGTPRPLLRRTERSGAKMSSSGGPPAPWHRLSREELREFIQLELDFALHQYK